VATVTLDEVNVFEWIDDAIIESLDYLFKNGEEIDVGHWQGVPTGGRPDLITKEIINLQWSARMPETMEEAVALISPNMPWAEAHFQERVAGEPTNPGVEYENWPWWKGQDKDTMVSGKFTHTYQERFWPKYAGNPHPGEGLNLGIRYHYGDLIDVERQLIDNPFTRQATFPIFFPEDTGATHGGRVPCTLHYHFMLRNGKLHCWYAIRSCDAIRHFRDDIYMAVRLTQWVLDKLYDPATLWAEIEPGYLNFNAYSFHVHKGDLHRYDSKSSEAQRTHKS